MILKSMIINNKINYIEVKNNDMVKEINRCDEICFLCQNEYVYKKIVNCSVDGDKIIEYE